MFRPHTSTIQSRHDLRLHGGVEAGAKASSRSRWCCAENIHERKEEVDDMEDGWKRRDEETTVPDDGVAGCTKKLN